IYLRVRVRLIRNEERPEPGAGRGRDVTGLEVTQRLNRNSRPPQDGVEVIGIASKFVVVRTDIDEEPATAVAEEIANQPLLEVQRIVIGSVFFGKGLAS